MGGKTDRIRGRKGRTCSESCQEKEERGGGEWDGRKKTQRKRERASSGTYEARGTGMGDGLEGKGIGGRRNWRERHTC